MARYTNLIIYLAIAEETLAESIRLLEAGRNPKPSPLPGFILSVDPERKSFKQSLIAIAFAGIYLEALLSLIICERLGEDTYRKIDRKEYEVKLKTLGVDDKGVLTDCKRFRKARNDVMHEKALDFELLKSREIRVAQEEAVFGVEFVKSISNKLRHLILETP